MGAATASSIAATAAATAAAAVDGGGGGENQVGAIRRADSCGVAFPYDLGEKR